MSIWIETAGGVGTVVLSGRFDAHETEEFRRIVEPLCIRPDAEVRLDLSQVTFLDTAACSELTRAHSAARDAGGQVVLVGQSDSVKVILELVGGATVTTFPALYEPMLDSEIFFTRRTEAPMPDEGTAAVVAGSVLQFDIAETGIDEALLVLSGRLDAGEALLLAERLGEADLAEAVSLVFDLSAVNHIDSAGLALIVKARRECRSRGGDVRLILPAGEAAMRIFRLTQFDRLFAIATE